MLCSPANYRGLKWLRYLSVVSPIPLPLESYQDSGNCHCFLVVYILSQDNLIAEGAHPNSQLKGAGPYTTPVLYLVKESNYNHIHAATIS